MAKRSIDKENAGKIITELSILDPWTVYAADGLVKRGFPPALIERLSRRFDSSYSDPKTTLFKDGQVVPSTKGVYSLELARAVASILRVKYEPAFGRGTEFHRIVDALKAAYVSGQHLTT